MPVKGGGGEEGEKGGSLSALMSIRQLDDAGRLLITVPANQTDRAVRNEHCALGFKLWRVGAFGASQFRQSDS